MLIFSASKAASCRTQANCADQGQLRRFAQSQRAWTYERLLCLVKEFKGARPGEDLEESVTADGAQWLSYNSHVKKIVAATSGRLCFAVPAPLTVLQTWRSLTLPDILIGYSSTRSCCWSPFGHCHVAFRHVADAIVAVSGASSRLPPLYYDAPIFGRRILLRCKISTE